MSKSANSGKGGSVGSPTKGPGSPGRGRTPNGFFGGNWPSRKPNTPSGTNRGNAVPAPKR